MRRSGASMTSSGMRRLKAGRAVPADSAALTSAARISATFSATFSAICLAAADVREDVTRQRPDEGHANIRKSVRITFEEAVFGCEKELDVVLKDPCPIPVTGQALRPGTSPETCPKCGGKGQVVYTSAVLLRHRPECSDLSGVSSVAGKIIREKCPDCSAALDTLPAERRFHGIRSRPVSTTVRASASVIRENRE